jgi:hypothetical protein
MKQTQVNLGFTRTSRTVDRFRRNPKTTAAGKYRDKVSARIMALKPSYTEIYGPINKITHSKLNLDKQRQEKKADTEKHKRELDKKTD